MKFTRFRRSMVTVAVIVSQLQMHLAMPSIAIAQSAQCNPGPTCNVNGSGARPAIVDVEEGASDPIAFLFEGWNNPTYFWDFITQPLESANRDIRCSSNSNVNQTTSRADKSIKEAAATNFYREFVGTSKQRVRENGIFTITWADGGSTAYFVDSSANGISLKVSPTFGEVFGDGVVNPSPTCI